MADLLTHALLAYALATALSVRYDWITPNLVSVAMLGAIVPDLSRAALLLPAETVETLFGVPFSWGAFHTLGGTLVVVGLGALLVPDRLRVRVALLLLLGALSHHSLDVLLLTPTGYTYEVLWPVTNMQPPAPDLYLSSDRWPAVVSAAVAAGTWYVVRRSGSADDRSGPASPFK